MEWFYADQGQSIGPVTEPEFQRMIALGTITSETHVWRDGLAGWRRWAEVVPPASAPPVIPAGVTNGVACCECGRWWPPEDVVQIAGNTVCAACKPIHLQRLQEGAPSSGVGSTLGLWREGKVLVVRTGAELPPRCVRCNQPSSWTGRIKLKWNPPWVFLAIVLSLLLLVFLALVMQKTATVGIPLCRVHQRRRTVGRRVALFAALAGIMMIPLSSLTEDFGKVGFIAGILGALLGAAAYSRMGWVLMPVQIDASYARLQGCCPAFLAGLPPFPKA